MAALYRQFKVGSDGKFRSDSRAFMRVCGQQPHFWQLTVNCMEFCAVPVHSQRFCVGTYEVKGRVLAKVAPWPVVDKWNHIINGSSVSVKITC